MTVSEDRIIEFKEAIKNMCEEYGLGFYLTNDDCYECGGGQMNVVELLENTDDVTMYPFFDLRAQNEKGAEAEHRNDEYRRKWEEKRKVNARLFTTLSGIFLKHQTVLWADGWARVVATPFNDAKWKEIRNAPLSACPFRCPTLAERTITEEHKARLPAFWEDVEALVREIGLLPDPDGLPRRGFYQFSVSPIFDDPLPDWILPYREEGHAEKA